MIAVVAHHASGVLHALSHFFGLDNLSGPFYGFWSGSGSDIQELTVIVGGWALLRHHNCHVKGCWGLRTHLVDGTPYRVCRKHHPTAIPKRVTAEHVRQAHHTARKGRPSGSR